MSCWSHGSPHSIEYRFFCNKFGWKNDLKELLREIYSFDKPEAVMPITRSGAGGNLVIVEDESSTPDQKSTQPCVENQAPIQEPPTPVEGQKRKEGEERQEGQKRQEGEERQEGQKRQEGEERQEKESLPKPPSPKAPQAAKPQAAKEDMPPPRKRQRRGGYKRARDRKCLTRKVFASAMKSEGQYNQRLIRIVQTAKTSAKFKRVPTIQQADIDKLNSRENPVNKEILRALGGYDGWKLGHVLKDLYKQQAKGKEKLLLPHPDSIAKEQAENLEQQEIENLTDEEMEEEESVFKCYDHDSFEERERRIKKDKFAISRVALLRFEIPTLLKNDKDLRYRSRYVCLYSWWNDWIEGVAPFTDLECAIFSEFKRTNSAGGKMAKKTVDALDKLWKEREERQLRHHRFKKHMHLYHPHLTKSRYRAKRNALINRLSFAKVLTLDRFMKHSVLVDPAEDFVKFKDEEHFSNAVIVALSDWKKFQLKKTGRVTYGSEYTANPAAGEKVDDFADAVSDDDDNHSWTTAESDEGEESEEINTLVAAINDYKGFILKKTGALPNGSEYTQEPGREEDRLQDYAQLDVPDDWTDEEDNEEP
ncbi:Oidioi.mRNA.OKI2018_I69.chr1.g2569.t1.cds [Oikopleura dioica]|uniref:Oidioi.mRNA.OKI2018_I69.chr1.g2569.t1.cds n=1 Tax=Oikopleura dioica TaxID=34765 RepID=A0ABN7SVQ9_OIKDI|nr:Oidioi.mRNA.OKI2018_I69.chr1.g2569.t1.cds [Oikopleura dioica]